MSEFVVPTKDNVTCVHCGHRISNHDEKSVCKADGCGYALCCWWDENDSLKSSEDVWLIELKRTQDKLWT
jgi:hypothetical protein